MVIASENPDRSNDDGNSVLLEVLRARRIAQLKTEEIPLKNDSIGYVWFLFCPSFCVFCEIKTVIS